MELFGTARQEEFASAIAAFAVQFVAPLEKGAGGGFNVGYHTIPQSACLEEFRMRKEPCYVRFEYEKRNTMEAWLECLTAEDQILVLRWANLAWEIIGEGCLPGDTIVVAPNNPPHLDRVGQVALVTWRDCC